MVTASLWVGLKVAMATLNGRSQPYGYGIPVGGAKGYHGNTKRGGANPYVNSMPVGGAKGHHGNTKMGGAKPYW